MGLTLSRYLHMRLMRIDEMRKLGLQLDDGGDDAAAAAAAADDAAMRRKAAGRVGTSSIIGVGTTSGSVAPQLDVPGGTPMDPDSSGVADAHANSPLSPSNGAHAHAHRGLIAGVLPSGAAAAAAAAASSAARACSARVTREREDAAGSRCLEVLDFNEHSFDAAAHDPAALAALKSKASAATGAERGAPSPLLVGAAGAGPVGEGSGSAQRVLKGRKGVAGLVTGHSNIVRAAQPFHHSPGSMHRSVRLQQLQANSNGNGHVSGSGGGSGVESPNPLLQQLDEIKRPATRLTSVHMGPNDGAAANASAAASSFGATVAPAPSSSSSSSASSSSSSAAAAAFSASSPRNFVSRKPSQATPLIITHDHASPGSGISSGAGAGPGGAGAVVAGGSGADSSSGHFRLISEEQRAEELQQRLAGGRAFGGAAIAGAAPPGGAMGSAAGLSNPGDAVAAAAAAGAAAAAALQINDDYYEEHERDTLEKPFLAAMAAAALAAASAAAASAAAASPSGGSSSSGASASAPAPIIKWKKGELLGFGAYGHVYLGLNLENGQLMAVKQVPLLAPSLAQAGCSSRMMDLAVMALEQEIEMMKALPKHENIVAYLGTLRERESCRSTPSRSRSHRHHHHHHHRHRSSRKSSKSKSKGEQSRQDRYSEAGSEGEQLQQEQHASLTSAAHTAEGETTDGTAPGTGTHTEAEAEGEQSDGGGLVRGREGLALSEGELAPGEGTAAHSGAGSFAVPGAGAGAGASVVPGAAAASSSPGCTTTAAAAAAAPAAGRPSGCSTSASGRATPTSSSRSRSTTTTTTSSTPRQPHVQQRMFNIFLEYVPGGSIASLLKKFGKFNEGLVKIYVKQILQGLRFLHQRGVLHRDVKAGNILVDNKSVCKLADFGAAARMQDMGGTGSGASGAHEIAGSAYWMAPEVIRQCGHGRQADIWSLGATVIEMVSGRPPWHQFPTHVSAMLHIATTSDYPDIPAELSPEAKHFTMHCLNRDARKRPNADRLLLHPFVTGRKLGETAWAPRGPLASMGPATSPQSMPPPMLHPPPHPHPAPRSAGAVAHHSSSSRSGHKRAIKHVHPQSQSQSQSQVQAHNATAVAAAAAASGSGSHDIVPGAAAATGSSSSSSSVAAGGGAAASAAGPPLPEAEPATPIQVSMTRPFPIGFSGSASASPTADSTPLVSPSAPHTGSSVVVGGLGPYSAQFGPGQPDALPGANPRTAAEGDMVFANAMAQQQQQREQQHAAQSRPPQRQQLYSISQSQSGVLSESNSLSPRGFAALDAQLQGQQGQQHQQGQGQGQGQEQNEFPQYPYDEAGDGAGAPVPGSDGAGVAEVMQLHHDPLSESFKNAEAASAAAQDLLGFGLARLRLEGGEIDDDDEEEDGDAGALDASSAADAAGAAAANVDAGIANSGDGGDGDGDKAEPVANEADVQDFLSDQLQDEVLPRYTRDPDMFRPLSAALSRPGTRPGTAVAARRRAERARLRQERLDAGEEEGEGEGEGSDLSESSGSESRGEEADDDADEFEYEHFLPQQPPQSMQQQQQQPQQKTPFHAQHALQASAHAPSPSAAGRHARSPSWQRQYLSPHHHPATDPHFRFAYESDGTQLVYPAHAQAGLHGAAGAAGAAAGVGVAAAAAVAAMALPAPALGTSLTPAGLQQQGRHAYNNQQQQQQQQQKKMVLAAQYPNISPTAALHHHSPTHARAGLGPYSSSSAFNFPSSPPAQAQAQAASPLQQQQQQQRGTSPNALPPRSVSHHRMSNYRAATPVTPTSPQPQPQVLLPFQAQAQSQSPQPRAYDHEWDAASPSFTSPSTRSRTISNPTLRQSAARDRDRDDGGLHGSGGGGGGVDDDNIIVARRPSAAALIASQPSAAASSSLGARGYPVAAAAESQWERDLRDELEYQQAQNAMLVPTMAAHAHVHTSPHSDTANGMGSGNGSGNGIRRGRTHGPFASSLGLDSPQSPTIIAPPRRVRNKSLTPHH